MKEFTCFAFCGLISLPAFALGAEDIEVLKRELRELRQRTEQLEGKLQQLEAATNAPSPSNVSEPTSRGWSPADPIVLGSGPKYINISLDVLAAAGSSTAENVETLQLGGHDPRQRGITLQGAELTLEGRIDPYLRGQANTALFLTPDGETEVELEEAYLESMSLPWNLQLKAGQFLSEFGRLNATHPHAWDFVDAPLVNGRFFGEDGLRNPGARLSWLLPTPFYSELFFSVQNSHGETAHSFRSDREGDLVFGRPGAVDRMHNIGDLLFVPRYALSLDLTDTQTIVAGASGALGPNATSGEADTQIYGMDLFWKWKPVTHSGGFPFVTWQTEAMLRRLELGGYDGDPADPTVLPLPSETIKDYGFYSQIAYGFRKGWVAALRGDYVAPEDQSDYERVLGPDPDRASRWRLSPNLTWYPSEFSKVRLQYNFDRRNQIGDDHSVWLQCEFLLGSHGAHNF
jgi:hypothetical protein